MTCEELNLIIQKTKMNTSSFSTSLGRSTKYVNVAINQAQTRGGHFTHNFAALVNQHHPNETRAVIGDERSNYLSELPPIQKRGAGERPETLTIPTKLIKEKKKNYYKKISQPRREFTRNLKRILKSEEEYIFEKLSDRDLKTLTKISFDVFKIILKME